MPGHPAAPYSLVKGIVRALRRRCPGCGRRGISRHMAAVDQFCPHCGLDLERQVGSFVGGVGINTIISLAALVVTMTAGFIWTRGEGSVPRVLLPSLAVAVIVPFFFYARSKLVWTAVELRWWPLDRPDTAPPAN